MRSLLFNLRLLLIRCRYRMLLICALHLFVAFAFIDEFRISQIAQPLNFGDVFSYGFFGVRQYLGNQREQVLQFPILWMSYQAGVLLFLGDHATEGISGYGTQAFVRGGSRVGWFTHSMLVEILVVLLYYALYAVVLAGLMLLWQGDVQFSLEVAQLPYLLSPLSMTASLVALQLLLSLFVSPILAFAGVQGLLVASVYASSPVLLGSYGMLLRSDLYMHEGFSPAKGIGACLFALLVASCLSVIRVHHLDIVEKDVNDRWR